MDERGVQYPGHTYLNHEATSMDQDPALVELRQWRDEQRTPLSEEELARVCYAAINGSMRMMRTMIKVQLRTIFALELLIFAIGIIIGFFGAHIIPM